MELVDYKRLRPVRWAEDGSGQVEVLSSDNVTWYPMSIDADGYLACECKGYWGHGKCYHQGSAAFALETGVSGLPMTPGQEAFKAATANDPRRLEVRFDLFGAKALQPA